MPETHERQTSPTLAERCGAVAARWDGWRAGKRGSAIAAGLSGLALWLWQPIGALLAGTARVVSTAWRGARPWQRALAIVVLGLAGLTALLWDDLDLPYHRLDAALGRRPLLAARSWHYQLTNASVDELAKSDADVLVIDYATAKGSLPLSPAEVARLKVKPDGKPRIVVSYLSIGEAEIWRWYWRADWQGDDMPGWEVAENCAWPGAHMVRFWHNGWRDIVYQGRRSYLRRIVDAGFDGVYLDRVDVWEQLLGERPTARQDMIDFVAELAETARAMRPGFLIIPQNAEALLEDHYYRNVIDALGKEDLLYGAAGTGQRNSERDIGWSQRHLDLLLQSYKPVFAVEYLTTKPDIERVSRELRERGLVPTFQHRSLDGSDPTDTTLPRATEVHGTPEWTAANCKDKRWW